MPGPSNRNKMQRCDPAFRGEHLNVRKPPQGRSGMLALSRFMSAAGRSDRTQAGAICAAPPILYGAASKLTGV
jgi:hypothetical protein